uniref:NADH-ubiquinone oxidoreductase chain 2 n=1 Tax=Platyrrhinus lineatus nigellus TaxID=574066 RepID=B7TAR9_9CHIR|nr:NADH dehydrogenase subunit 2 [Platyrrhinus lineatus nigellus]ACJ35398.1 NADH dehydrogenase subunit 2 [Platyrrhinus lineatus nigellus]ACJ35399.1 NADH dehydrogenase subunit 2 [Platyrrhinus lineatus nigellus]ACJ35400.1 NADH dehydrogenase subunit 2 [Platyrrhinus lineatus nigellus]AYG99308.1 NADH dehydrogenase subunit 2 [Platyrrhinus umbratus]
MNPLIFSVIMSTVILGTTIVMTSSHWLMVWIGFEMNMLAIIPVLMKTHHPRSTEAATKYFLTQATASMLLMLAVIINLLYSGQWTVTNMMNPTASTILTLALTMKLGLSPFHFWVPEVTQGVPLSSGLILLTWQKLAPLSILYMISPNINSDLLLTMSILSILIGGWGGLNQTQLRKIMAYSSIAHMGWMTAILIYNPTMTLLNLTIYIMMTLTMFMLLINTTTTTTLSLAHTWNKTPLITIIILTTLLSLGGLPPLTGFMPKWMIIQELTKNNNIILPTFMAVTALLNLYFYMRLTYSTSLTMFPTTNNTKIKWHFHNTKQTMLLSPLTIMSTMTLPLAPLLTILY